MKKILLFILAIISLINTAVYSEELLEEIKKIAEQGQADAQFILGEMYLKGDGVPQDYKQATLWLTKAAEQGYAQAQVKIGLMYDYGLGVEKDTTQAFKWHQKAAEQEDAHAQFFLGAMYEYGHGVEQDYDKAFKLYRKAAEQGLGDAQYGISLMYYNGNGVPKNYIECYKWIVLAAAQGNKKAVEFKKELKLSLTSEQINKAQRLAAEFQTKKLKGQLVTGQIVQSEETSLIVDLGWARAILPRSELISGEKFQQNTKVVALVLDVRETQEHIEVILSRTNPNFVCKLFEQEVPEIAEGIVEIKAVAREAGQKTKLAVYSKNENLDAVGACVGIKGKRINNVVEQIGGELIDLIRWDSSTTVFLTNALMPARVGEIFLCPELKRITVIVPEDQLLLAIGKEGQDVRLAAQLTGWDLDLLIPEEYNRELDLLKKNILEVEGANAKIIDSLVEMGVTNISTVVEIGSETIAKKLGVDREFAESIVIRCKAENKKDKQK